VRVCVGVYVFVCVCVETPTRGCQSYLDVCAFETRLISQVFRSACNHTLKIICSCNCRSVRKMGKGKERGRGRGESETKNERKP